MWILTAALLTGCAESDGYVGPSSPGETWSAQDTDTVPVDTGTAIQPLSGFSWVIDDQLAGMPLVGQLEGPRPLRTLFRLAHGSHVLFSVVPKLGPPLQLDLVGALPCLLPGLPNGEAA